MKYHRSERGSSGEIYSVDKLVEQWRFGQNGANALLDMLGRNPFMLYRHWEAFKVGTYRDQFSIETPEGDSFYLGVGLNTWGKVGQNARLEYNPNKVGQSRELFEVQIMLSEVGKDMTVKQYDLAADFPLPREKLELMKGAKMYEEVRHSDENRTQYQGQRNKAGRCKVYNKQLEAKTREPLTRIELTCGGDWTMVDIEANLPRVRRLDWQAEAQAAVVGFSDTDLFILKTLVAAPERLEELSRRKREKMVAAMAKLSGAQLERELHFDLPAIERLTKGYGLM